VRNHEQCLDIETGLLTCRYDCGEDHYETELFVHPTLSLFVYRFGGNGRSRLPSYRLARSGFRRFLRAGVYAYAPAESGVRREAMCLFVKARSNIYCPL